MSDLLHNIHMHLNTPKLRDNLPALFCETFLWGRPQGQPRSLPIGAPVNRPINVVPIATLSGLPVFRVDWDSDKLPTITQRRAVHKALASTALEHLLCYVTNDGRQAAFVWARRRGKKVELRTLPYEVGSLARTTVERLSKLAFSLEELGHWGGPSITQVTDKLDSAFDVEAVTKEFFVGYKAVFDRLQDALCRATRDKVWAHDHALQLLNRLMFLYFIQRKRWLGGTPTSCATSGRRTRLRGNRRTASLKTGYPFCSLRHSVSSSRRGGATASTSRLQSEMP